MSILWNVPDSSWSGAGEVPQVSLREGDNIIIVEVTVRNGFSRLRYFVEVTKLESPPVLGGPLPLSCQPSSLADKSSGAANSPTADWKSRLMAADSLPNGGVRFVFLVSAEEFQIEETVDLLSGE